MEEPLLVLEDQLTTGIMHDDNLSVSYEYFDGMLFLMETSSNCFWMKGCIISLDIIFINDNVITKIFEKCPPCYVDNCPSYCAKGSIILEVASGTCNRLGIQKGDRVSYSLF